MVRNFTPLLMVTLLFFGMGCAENAPHAPPQTLGEHAVGYITFSATDSQREDRTLVIDVWYPADSQAAASADLATYPLSAIFGMESEVALDAVAVDATQKLPLLVFSHGYGGINRQSLALMEALPSHGFIVAAPEHTGNAQNSLTDSFDVAAGNRVPDLSFVIDTMLSRNLDSEDMFFGRIDENLVGALGHSFGGMTTLGSACGWAQAPADTRVKAIAPMSAVIDGERQEAERNSPYAGFSSEQLGSITVPTMLVGGTEDISVPIENNAIAFEQITQAPILYKVDITGANHTHFTNVCDIGDFLIETGFPKENWANMGAEDLIEPYERTCSETSFPMSEFNRLLNLYVVSFFKLHLLEEAAYEDYLSGDFADTETAIGFELK